MDDATQRDLVERPESAEQAEQCEALFDENGVDLTLVRHTLRLTPTERLLVLQKFMNVLATVRRPNLDSK